MDTTSNVVRLHNGEPMTGEQIGAALDVLDQATLALEAVAPAPAMLPSTRFPWRPFLGGCAIGLVASGVATGAIAWLDWKVGRSRARRLDDAMRAAPAAAAAPAA